MIRNFIDRENELNFLEERYQNKNFENIVIYGRRRIGKTEIIKQFIKDKPAIYHLSDQRGTKKNIERMLESLSKKNNLPSIRADSIDELFSSIIKIYGNENRLIVVLDEFPYLVERDDTIPSVMQLIIDEIIANSQIFLILCGSSIGMMEKYTLEYKSPLHGRRTGQIKVESLPFKETLKFFPEYNFIDQFYVFSIIGGVPAYLNMFDPNMSLELNIQNTFLQKDHIFFEEVEQLLRSELREPKQYMNILEAIALGNTRIVNIANYSGLVAKDLPVYLNTLIKLGLVERIIPITERRSTSKRTIYRLKDPFFRFWFQFILPHKSEIELGRIKEVWELIERRLNQYTSLEFEKICAEHLRTAKIFPFMINKVGTWWLKDTEIDLVAIDQVNNQIILAECKWQEKINGEQLLEQLKEKAAKVDWKRGERNEYYIIYARSFKKRGHIAENIRYFDINDLNEHFI